MLPHPACCRRLAAATAAARPRLSSARPPLPALRALSLLSHPPRQPAPLLPFLRSPRRPLTVHARPPLVPPDEPLDSDPVMILTEPALTQITRAQQKAQDPNLALRVAVESGGCHGYQYKMEVTSDIDDEDYLFLPPTSPARLVVDPSSLALLSGATIDYATELIGSSFRIRANPHASDKGGCGCGVSWELKE